MTGYRSISEQANVPDILREHRIRIRNLEAVPNFDVETTRVLPRFIYASAIATVADGDLWAPVDAWTVATNDIDVDGTVYFDVVTPWVGSVYQVEDIGSGLTQLSILRDAPVGVYLFAWRMTGLFASPPAAPFTSEVGQSAGTGVLGFYQFLAAGGGGLVQAAPSAPLRPAQEPLDVGQTTWAIKLADPAGGSAIGSFDLLILPTALQDGSGLSIDLTVSVSVVLLDDWPLSIVPPP